ncbi:hypothetical protein V4889_20600 [Ralstonia solanacearum species complex bacterium KE101]|uniref:hypothetical protein n=1 Tax=Ralstonia solanacearum species complex bacterium KE101 TaxID=3119587 RepID=UPI000AC6B358|nr:hypothetical protein [Ralstonia solanacearum]NKA68856.1 hypothetical protein [Ralstonia solanacearum]NKA83744.1 hypothetical protein [Ralstonia solanacearum]NKF55128.1 hypothetical protein [Ralstonia solanacearum]NKF59991.1 hypothetical protein [Ralstonia solanacearum]
MSKAPLHAVAGTLAMLLIATFWTSTAVSELFLDAAAVATVKHCIALYGLAEGWPGFVKNPPHLR